MAVSRALEDYLFDEYALASPDESPLCTSNAHRADLYGRFADKLIVNPHLTRSLVSFQANKRTPFYRWFKYKEGFSSDFVTHILEKLRPEGEDAPRVLDPFAGAGTTLTTGTKAGWHATGIELLPVGTAAIRARLTADTVDMSHFERCLDDARHLDFSKNGPREFRFPHLRITEKAFPAETESAISSYRTFVNGIADDDVRYLFWFACLSVLEEVSYTRKDGQYLRWDLRSGRPLKSCFDKGPVREFRPAILQKLETMLQDIRNRNGGSFSSNVEVLDGSCLSLMPDLPSESFDLIITSPPYCNRYDYTRTYALELAYLGYDETRLKTLRQTLLSATVENRTKRNQLREEYGLRNQDSVFDACASTFSGQTALQEVLSLLYAARDDRKLNNNSIPGMVEHYFFEMCFVVYEMSRVLRPGGRIVMVNDNVQYGGEEVPVDLILSDFATKAGLAVECIWVLPIGKGNSSQQMGVHGRNELRKCVYVWSKPRD